MFPRFNTSHRLFVILISVVTCFLLYTLTTGGPRPFEYHLNYVSVDGHPGHGQREFIHDASPSALSQALRITQSLLVNERGHDPDRTKFIRNVEYRFNISGIKVLRELKSAEAPVIVDLPVPPVNPHNFRYVHNPSSICSQPPSFLIYIHSAPANVKRRQVIRQTWGNPQLLSLLNASMIFALGVPPDSVTQKKLDMESEQYGDLLQEDYADSYRNLTFKGMSVLKWAHSFCKQPLFFIKTDDDILLDVVSIVDHVLTKVVPARGAKKLVLCNLWTTMKVIRDPNSKWGLSKKEFASDLFPPYCSGSAFILSGDMVPLMYGTALRTPFFWVDDYFITGALVNKLGVQHERLNSAYLLNGLQIEEKLKADRQTIMVLHIKNYPLFFKAWDLLMARHLGMKSFISSYSTFDIPALRKRLVQTIASDSKNGSMTPLPPSSNSSHLPLKS